MSRPVGQKNANACIIDNVDELGLAVSSATLGQAVVTSSDIPLPGKGTLIVMCDMTSGTATIKVDEFAAGASHNFGSPKGTLSASTTAQYLALDFTDASTLNFAIEIDPVDGIVGELVVMFIQEKTPGEGWYAEHTAQNATESSKTGDGSGVVVRTLLADHTFPGNTTD